MLNVLLGAAERQNPAHQILRTIGRPLDLGNGNRGWMTFGQVLHCELRIAGHCGEQVVEVVRDAASERAERFHFLRLS